MNLYKVTDSGSIEEATAADVNQWLEESPVGTIGIVVGKWVHEQYARLRTAESARDEALRALREANAKILRLESERAGK